MNFDEDISRKRTWSTKWDKYGDLDIIPMWVSIYFVLVVVMPWFMLQGAKELKGIEKMEVKK